MPWRSPAWWAAIVSLLALLLNAKLGNFSPAGFLAVWIVFAASWPARSLRCVAGTSWLPWAFPALALLSALWSAAPGVSLRAALELAATTSAALILAGSLNARDILSALMCVTQMACLASLVFAGTRVMGNAGGQALVGVFGSKNYLAYITGLAVIAAFAVLADGRQPRPLRAIAATGMLSAPLLLWQSKSVGAMAAVGGSVAVLGFCTLLRVQPARWRMPVLACALGLCAITGAALGGIAAQQQGQMLAMVGKDAGLTGRAYLWGRASTYIAQRPAAGIGYQAFWREDSLEASGLWRWAKVAPGAGFHFHNLFYETAVELGFAGVLVLGATIAMTLRRILEWQMGAPDPQSCFFVALAAFMLLRGYVEVDLLYPFGIGSVLLPVAWVAARRAALPRPRSLARVISPPFVASKDARMNYHAAAEPTMMPVGGAEPPPFAWLPHLLGFLRRRLFEIGLCLAVCLALGTTYLLTATPKFTATAKILIDPRAPDIFKQAPITISDAESESATVDSQLEILQSDGVARQVVDQEHLLQNEAFNHPPSGLIGEARAGLDAAISMLTGPGPGQSVQQQRTRAALRLMAMEKLRRIGLSNVLEIDVTSPSPALAASLANAAGKAFIDNELQSNYDASRRASVWMEDHLAQLHAQASEADAKAQNFRAQHRLLNTDKGQLDQQRLGELSTALAAAHARTAEARGRLAGIQGVLAKDIDGATSDSLGNLVIVKLREQYFDDASRASEWSARYGASHEAVLALHRDMIRLRGAMKSELDRIAQSYASDLQVAAAAEQAVQSSYDAAIGQSAASNTDQVILRGLQSNADTYGGLYQNFLQRYTLAAQDQSFPISQARIVSAAAVPVSKSAPMAALILGVSGVLGMMFGLGLAFARETLNQGLYTASQTQHATGLACIGLIPIIERRGHAALPAPARDQALVPRQTERSLTFGDPLLNYAKAAPFSAFSEAMRHLHVTVQRHTRTGRGTVLGCVSSETGEGKSTIICNLAVLMAASGRRVILLDWDLRKRTLTRALAPQARHGLAEVALGEASLEDAIFADGVTGLHFLPASPADYMPGERHASEVLGLAGTADLLLTLQNNYDMVLIDLPPLQDVADAHSVGHLMDVLIMVAAWGRTHVDQINERLARLSSDRTRTLGLVLNKVDSRKMRHYARTPARYGGVAVMES